jgi:Ca2+-binding RTX toxin-like protein
MAIDTTLDQVEALYIGYFGRAGEPDGVNYWVGQLNGGYAVADMAASFSVQDEAKAEYPFLAHPELVTDPVGFINAIYMNLFERAPDQDGLDYWTEQLLGRGGDAQAIGQFIQDVISGAQGDDITTLDNKVDAASYYTNELAEAGIGGTHLDENGHGVLDANLVASADAAVAGVSSDPATVEASHTATDEFVAGGGGTPDGGTFTLTAGTDFADVAGSVRNGGTIPSDFHFTANNETVSATTTTLNATDSLADGSTTDNDHLHFSGSGANGLDFDAATVSNIEHIDVTASAKATGTIDLSTFTGVHDLTVTGALDAAGGAVTGFALSGITAIDTSAATGGGFIITDGAADQAMTINTGAMNDIVALGKGDNTIHTGAGADQVVVTDGDNTIDTGAGADNVTVGNGDNTIDLGNGANFLNGGNGNNTVTSLEAVDTIVLGNGDNTISSGAGNDVIAVGSGNNAITAGVGADQVNILGNGDNVITIAAGDSGITTATADIITGFDGGGDNALALGTAGSATNYLDLANGANTVELAIAAVTAAGSLDHTVQYVRVDNGADSFLVVDSNLDGTADAAVHLVGVTGAEFTFNDIVSGAVA